MNQQATRRNLVPVVLLSTGLLGAAALAAYFGYERHTLQEHQRAMEAKIVADSARIMDLDARFQAAHAELLSYKGLNRELDSIIALKEEELNRCRSQFLTLVRRNKITEAECAKHLAALRHIDSTFRQQILALQAANKLADIERDSLGRLVLAQRDSLTILKATNKKLSKKVELASLLKPTAIEVTGLRTKSSGKDAKTGKAKKIDQLKICFTLPKNEIAEADTQIFLIRIINPEGTTFTSATGTRTFIHAETGNPLPYSISAVIHYKNVEVTPCVYFRQDVTYINGTYTIEIYQNGYLVGTQRFDLK
ncbi:MAG: hypothetical protein NZL95_00175 [Chitinophagales bacterium]|nr:hypothetical protein [Chitinophagales bacterium]MDW8426956.1 hypothetical protein [Chitinophagales bacterium]